MSDPVLSLEAGEQDSSPRELIDISYGATVHRITTGTRDIGHGGYVYTATAAARGEIGVSKIDDSDRDLTVTLPIDHPAVRRFLRMIVPPLKITITLQRLYPSIGQAELVFVGEVTSMSADDENTEATFRVPARANDAAQRMLPTITVSRVCPYILYGAGCNANRLGTGPSGVAFQITTTAINVNGRDVRVDLLNTARLGGWSEGGELVVASGEAIGERMSIREQMDLNPPFSSVASLSLQLPIPGLKNGDAVTVAAGCRHDIGTCRTKFGNKDNFGGYPSLPTSKPFSWER